MSRIPVKVCAAVIRRDGKFLITKRLATSPMGHCWEFPGGKREPGETIEGCTLREVREEIGIEVKMERILEEMTYDYPHGLIHLTFVLCSVVSGEPQTLGCSEIRWIEAHQFKDFEFPPADVGVIEGLTRPGSKKGYESARRDFFSRNPLPLKKSGKYPSRGGLYE